MNVQATDTKELAAADHQFLLPPADAETQAGIGAAILKTGDKRNAKAMLLGAVAADADCGNAYNSLATIASDEAHYRTALSCAMRALATLPDSVPTLCNVGVNAWRCGLYDMALAHLLKALAIDPEWIGTHENLALVYYSMNQAEKSIEHWRKVLAVQPNRIDPRSDLSLALMKYGKLHEGLTSFECRWEGMLLKSPVWECGVPQWQGEDLDGKTLLIHHEQGYGDTIQFIRILPELERRYPGAQFRVLVPKALHKLIAHNFGPDRIFNIDRAGDIVKCAKAADFHSPMLSTVRAMGLEFDGFSGSIPYLRAPLTSPGARRTLKTPGTKVAVGVLWAASAGHEWSRKRSVPLEQVLRLGEVAGVRLYSLQVGPYAPELQKNGADVLMFDLTPSIDNFYDTATIMQELDLVISVDSGPAHLAGALGVPVWVFNPFTPCWRWCKGAGIWYESMKLFDQRQAGDNWAAQIETMQGMLQQMVKESANV